MEAYKTILPKETRKLIFFSVVTGEILVGLISAAGLFYRAFNLSAPRNALDNLAYFGVIVLILCGFIQCIALVCCVALTSSWEKKREEILNDNSLQPADKITAIDTNSMDARQIKIAVDALHKQPWFNLQMYACWIISGLVLLAMALVGQVCSTIFLAFLILLSEFMTYCYNHAVTKYVVDTDDILYRLKTIASGAAGK